VTLKPGEYVFKCLECDGKGSVEVGGLGDEGDGEDWADPHFNHELTFWEDCSECHGTGEVFVDEEDAAEYVKWGHTPLRAPGGWPQPD
jgi:hypothetical protein